MIGHHYPAAKVRYLSGSTKFSAGIFRLRTLLPHSWMEYPYPCQDTTIRVRYPCKRASPINNLYHWKHPSESRRRHPFPHHAPAHDLPARERPRVLRGPGLAPLRSKFSAEYLVFSTEICIFAPENPTPTERTECQPPERILRTAAHVTAKANLEGVFAL